MNFQRAFANRIGRVARDVAANGRWRHFFAVAVLLLINITVSRKLWLARFTNQLGSVEGTYISISRYALHHWGDLQWFPLWFCGMPFLQVYQRGFHLTIAALAGLLYSLFSPAARVSSVVRADLGGLWLARRYQELVHYGEGPHIAVVTLLPLIILSLDHMSFPTGRNRSERRVGSLTLIALLAAVVLMNWPG